VTNTPKSLLHLAASLGSEVARARLQDTDSLPLDNAFEQLMSCSEFLPDGFNYAPPRIWPYSHEAALRMGVAAFREFIPDWQAAFREQGGKIPNNVSPDFPQTILRTIEGWLAEPQKFHWDDHGELYCYIKDDTCLDGYLTNDFPEVPKLVSAWCLGSFMLIDPSNWEDPFDRKRVFGAGTGVGYDEFNPARVFSANVPDGIAYLLAATDDDTRIRNAIERELIPWCLAKSQ
jgi:hypothetical protein